MKILYGIFTFVIGLIIMFIFAGVFSSSGGGQVTSSSFNSGIMALSTAILFLCGIIVVCTLMIISVLKNKH
ncbi:hypothetical protein [Clostridium sp.]|uniref:hypothetical protein n=1 Tax=Clostridium sp. TaxID=1506 RepID=UPI002582EDEB|nr:hypothetical protein [Clostridium sp.]MDF2506063.1 hypothetical protein [Clostridium sp.]